MITNTNRPFSGADPGICGTGETNFDSENTWFLFLRLEIKNGLSTLRGEKAPCHLQFIKNFSLFPSLSFDEPNQVNTVRLNCSFFGANHFCSESVSTINSIYFPHEEQKK